MKKIILIFLIVLAPLTSFALCTQNNPMCDVNFLDQQPIFLGDDWFNAPSSIASFSISLAHDNSLKKPTKINTPYTIRCLISMKNFVNRKDQEQVYVRWGYSDDSRADTSRITYIAWNEDEHKQNEIPLYNTNNTITLHAADGYIYLKHIIMTGNTNVGVRLEGIRRDLSFSCIAVEEMRNLTKN